MFSYYRVIFSEIESNGGYVKVTLNTYCQGDNYLYNEITDSCDEQK